MIPFDFEQTAGKPGGSELLDRILSRLRATLGSLAETVTNDRLVDVTFAAPDTDVQVFHGLGFPPVSWEIVDKTANVDVWRSATPNSRPRDTIILRSNIAPLTIRIRFNGQKGRPPVPPADSLIVPVSLLAPFWLSRAYAGLPNGVDMGALGPGILQQTVTAGVATPDSFLPTAGSVLFAGAAGTLAQDNPNFFYDAAGVRWGFGTNVPSPSAIATLVKDQNSDLTLFMTNQNAGNAAGVGFLLQAWTDNTFGTSQYLVGKVFGRGYTPPPSTPFFTAGTAGFSFLSQLGGANFVVDLGNGFGSPDFIILNRDGAGTQQQKLRLLYGTGALRIASLSAGGYVKASVTDGELSVVSTIPVADVTGAVPSTRRVDTTAPLTGGGDLSANRTIAISDFAGSGVSHARGAVPDPGAVAGSTKFLREDATWATPAGSGGTVTAVTGTAPITSTGGTTPDIAINTFGASGGGHARGAVPDPGAGAGTTKFLREDATWAVPPDTGITQLTSDVTAGPGSGSQAATIANNAVTNAKLRDSAATSVIGRPGGSAGDPSDLVASADRQVLWRSGGGLGFALFDVVAFDYFISHTTTPAGSSGELVPSSMTPQSGTVPPPGIAFSPSASQVYTSGELTVNLLLNNLAGVETYAVAVVLVGTGTVVGGSIVLTSAMGSPSLHTATFTVSGSVTGDLYQVAISSNANSKAMVYTAVLRLYS